MASPDGITLSVSDTSGAASPQAAARSEAEPGALPTWLPILLGFLTAVGPVSTDIYLPAFPALEKSLHAAAGSAGMTLSAWMIGLAIGQITMGPLSDRFGRRIPMLVGMIVYTIGSVGCAISTSMLEMCFFRLVAAIAASASIVIPSACVRDLSSGNAAAKLMSKLILIQGVVPILAPMLGGMALSYISWRAIFWVSAIYGGLCVLLLLRVFPETLPTDNRRELRPLSLLQRYANIARERSFITNGLVWGFCGFLSFTYLTAAPTVFEHIFGFTPAHYGMLFGLFAVCMIGASQINGALVGRVSAGHMLGWALTVSVIGAVSLLVVVMLGDQYPGPNHHIRPIMLIPIVGCMMITLGTTGIIGPNAMVGALSNQAQFAGSASAFAGTMQYALGSLASTAIGLLPADTPMPMAVLMLFAALMMGVFAVLRPSLPHNVEQAMKTHAAEQREE
ncbi:multidrug effflux MFS transporter [Kozakia baliensis]|uniref:Bcr/CflA family efflux transporter n=1 Tax=Kozakia baliensis TaxID=153496 RepID=A0A1D8UW39_9PROT|nr:multidrug effflux MFS transporter [Kozakia baliensis]AOX17868.1 Bcr/CflA family drug resistance efflux transporter [Kozakia baliensis]AOX20747.1 Bcr/CflA family drug resistance efflux transporter [Kozakia baliensis]GBR26654.1 multidrug ABC transporter [Kozakia baliensis NRIC 0488]GEL64302.1 Bcr/CflA family drug resistance efflux transporter [Kozakia baliensis]